MSAKILVDKAALLKLLRALNGPPHLIKEMQVTRNLPGHENPIDKLVAEYKAQE